MDERTIPGKTRNLENKQYHSKACLYTWRLDIIKTSKFRHRPQGLKWQHWRSRLRLFLHSYIGNLLTYLDTYNVALVEAEPRLR